MSLSSCRLPGKNIAQISKRTDLPKVRQLLARASSSFELPGRRDEGLRAYERANDIILKNIDLLIAVWDGERAPDRAGTGDVVQRAAAMGLPTIVIDPKEPAVPAILEAPDDQNLAPSQVTELDRKAISDDLTGLVEQIIGPPPDTPGRQALRDLLTEEPHRASWRFEYRILMSWLAKESGKKKAPSTGDVMTEAIADSSDTGSFANTAEFRFLRRRQHFIDDLAVTYGDLFRSSSVSAYLLVIAGALASGIIWLVLPWLSTTAIAIQAIVNGLVLLDTAFSTRGRWQERWLEYRMVAQRLRWICLLHPLGLSVAKPVLVRAGRTDKDSWVNWYVNRSARSLGLPTGFTGAAYLRSATGELQDYIRQQSSYHHLSLRRLGLLEARLSLIAHGALITSIVVAAGLGVEIVRAGSESVEWKPVAVLLLTILPATTTAMNGLRAEMDLDRLIERSAQTAVLLARINRALSAAPITYDRLAVAASQSSAIMDSEISEWRFVLESRRARVGRNHRSIVSRIRRWTLKR